MKVKQMSPMVHRETFPQRKFCHKKKSFVLVNLFTPSFNWSHQEADICGEKHFRVSFT